MARIRSTHPGQWTDEHFVSCSAFARLLVLAIRNEADDQGIFEWNPIKIKMRLFPVDNIDVNELLGELIEHKQVAKFEHGGREYGAVRNFRKYQRPKTPNSLYPLPDEWRSYVGLGEPISEMTNDKKSSVTPKGEMAPQMEEEGGRRKEEGKQTSAPADEDFEPWYEAYPRHEARGQALKAYRAARKKASAEELLAGAKRAAGRYQGTERKFIPLPATWLNGERWLDQASIGPPGEGHRDAAEREVEERAYRGLL